MGSRHDGSSIQQYLDYFIIICVGGEDQRSDVWGEGRRVAVHRLPALSKEEIYPGFLQLAALILKDLLLTLTLTQGSPSLWMLSS